MAAILPLTLHRSIHNRTLASWIPTAVIAPVILMSVSRSAILVAGAGVLILLLRWPNRLRLLFLVGASAAVVVARLALPGLLGTIRALFAHLGDDPSIAGRTDDYSVVTRVFLETPWFGRGLFTWVPAYYRTLDNQLLVLLLELGVIGTLLFLTMVLAAILTAVTCKRRADERSAHLGLAIGASLAGITLSFITFDTLGFRQAGGMTFLLLGMAGAVWNLTRGRRDLLPPGGPISGAS